MKTRGRISVGAFALVLFLLILLPAIALAAEPIKWKFAILYPRGTIFTQLYHGFCEDVKRMSGGRLIIEDMYDGEGFKEAEVLGVVRSGLFQMGAPYPAIHAGELPAGVIELMLPGAPTTPFEMRSLFHHAGWKEVLRKAYAKHNAYWLGEYYQPGTYVLTKKPITKIEDFAKLKIRCPGAYGKMMRNLGAAPVVINFSEVYTALATGVVDGVDGCNIIDHRDGKFYEQAKYIYPLPLSGAQVNPGIVHVDAWNKLSDDLKAIVEVAWLWWGEYQGMKCAVWEKEALQEMMGKGLQWSPKPSAADEATWKEAGKKTWAEYEGMDEFCKEMIKIQGDFMKKMGL